MPIRSGLRWPYPTDWPQTSAAVRFGRAKGRCERCDRPHGHQIRQLADGRWYDADRRTWRDDMGREAEWPSILDYSPHKTWRVVLAAVTIDHNPSNCRPINLMALCQRCHITHSRAEHLRRRRITYLLRHAIGDLFAGHYPAPSLGMPAQAPPRQDARDEDCWRVRMETSLSASRATALR
jgi:hypothetical protein